MHHFFQIGCPTTWLYYRWQDIHCYCPCHIQSILILLHIKIHHLAASRTSNQVNAQPTNIKPRILPNSTAGTFLIVALLIWIDVEGSSLIRGSTGGGGKLPAGGGGSMSGGGAKVGMAWSGARLGAGLNYSCATLLRASCYIISFGNPRH